MSPSLHYGREGNHRETDIVDRSVYATERDPAVYATEGDPTVYATEGDPCKHLGTSNGTQEPL